MKRKILFIVTSHDRKGATGQHTGFHLSEVTHAYDVFQKSDYHIEFASPRGGKAPVDALDMSDPLNHHYMEEREFVRGIEDTMRVEQARSDDYIALFFPGGHGAMWDFPENRAIQSLVREHYESGGVIGAVCHGPAAIVNVKSVSGEYLVDCKEVSAFTNDEERMARLDDVVPFSLETRLREHGAKFISASPFKECVAISDRLVTGQNPASATGVAQAMQATIAREHSRLQRLQRHG